MIDVIPDRHLHGTIHIHKHRDVASNPSPPGPLLRPKLLYCFDFDSSLLAYPVDVLLAFSLYTIISSLRDCRVNEVSQKAQM